MNTDTGNGRHMDSDEFRTMIATSLEDLLLVDMSGHTLEVNDSFSHMAGYTRDQLLRNHISQANAVESAEGVAKRSEEVIQKGSLRFETKHRHKNGTVIDIEICSNYSFSHGGTFFLFIRDITS